MQDAVPLDARASGVDLSSIAIALTSFPIGLTSFSIASVWHCRGCFVASSWSPTTRSDEAPVEFEARGVGLTSLAIALTLFAIAPTSFGTGCAARAEVAVDEARGSRRACLSIEEGNSSLRSHPFFSVRFDEPFARFM